LPKTLKSSLPISIGYFLSIKEDPEQPGINSAYLSKLDTTSNAFS